MITRKIRGSRTFSPRYYREKIRFSISFVFRKNFLIYFIHFLEGVHRLVTIPCYIKHVARTHISISFITLGDFREEAPTPSKFQEPVPRFLFLRVSHEQCAEDERKKHVMLACKCFFLSSSIMRSTRVRKSQIFGLPCSWLSRGHCQLLRKTCEDNPEGACSRRIGLT